jgi:uncharacterized protein (DUF362 family)/Pyruvate/2-oxoacid:ferredoxin oxidoreductase delta subunit
MSSELLSTVALVRAESYERDRVDQAVADAVGRLGGWGRYVCPGMTVLLKPNMLSPRHPDQAVTTHPQVVAAVARQVRACGARVLVGDSPSAVKWDIERVWRETGLWQASREEGFELVNFEAAGSRAVAIDTRVFHIARPVLEADLVINVPKLKTHTLTLLSGALKNMYGSIPGFRKALWHKDAPRPRDFSQVIVDVFSAVQPQLTIMDAVVAMQGDGPSAGRPYRLGLVLASTDAVAVDTVACRLIGLRPEKVHMIRLAAEAGLGMGHSEAIEVVGEAVRPVRKGTFRLPSNAIMELLPPVLVNLAGPLFWMRPKVDAARCTGCQKCIEACPVGALSVDGAMPRINHHVCVTCWCCHETCPEQAVGIEKSWLARRLTADSLRGV